MAGAGVKDGPGDDCGGSGEGEFKSLIGTARGGLVNANGWLGVAGWDDYVYEVDGGREGRGRWQW